MKRLTAFRVGAWAWIATGTGHLVLDALMELRTETPEIARATAAMREYRLAFGGIERGMDEISQGMSLAMGVALVFSGLLLLRMARLAPALVNRSLCALALGMSAVVLAVSVWLLPTPPIALFTVATVAFGVAWSRAPRPSS
ncbi:LIC_13387 family protein [Longispora albida]|uniref:LIC_13387 family protein n=1 Tax=Longispora albida TaxID=203523 RepID=UPI0012F9252A|nr:hypothetical protein [Longispora albida]